MIGLGEDLAAITVTKQSEDVDVRTIKPSDMIRFHIGGHIIVYLRVIIDARLISRDTWTLFVRKRQCTVSTVNAYHWKLNTQAQIICSRSSLPYIIICSTGMSGSTRE